MISTKSCWGFKLPKAFLTPALLSHYDHFYAKNPLEPISQTDLSLVWRLDLIQNIYLAKLKSVREIGPCKCPYYQMQSLVYKYWYLSKALQSTHV